MQKEIRNIIAKFVAICLGMFLVACTQVWYLSISEDGSGNAILCFSQKANCRGEGVHFSGITFYEVDRKGVREKTVWAIDSQPDIENNTIIKKITLGIVPKNWTETHPYKAFEVEKFYSANGEYFFMKRKIGGFEILQKEDFYRKYVPKNK
ncbi:hypothetical protein, partial [Massilia scottii]|uniref:hypothetical protein n=1 Tax=Massilia scottii TaxID=3057166 RepID=UPI00279689B8